MMAGCYYCETNTEAGRVLCGVDKIKPALGGWTVLCAYAFARFCVYRKRALPPAFHFPHFPFMKDSVPVVQAWFQLKPFGFNLFFYLKISFCVFFKSVHVYYPPFLAALNAVRLMRGQCSSHHRVASASGSELIIAKCSFRVMWSGCLTSAAMCIFSILIILVFSAKPYCLTVFI